MTIASKQTVGKQVKVKVCSQNKTNSENFNGITSKQGYRSVVQDKYQEGQN